MTLDRDRPGKNLRPPMGPVAKWVIFGIVAAVFVFVGVVLAVSGQPLF